MSSAQLADRTALDLWDGEVIEQSQPTVGSAAAKVRILDLAVGEAGRNDQTGKSKHPLASVGTARSDGHTFQNSSRQVFLRQSKDLRRAMPTLPAPSPDGLIGMKRSQPFRRRAGCQRESIGLGVFPLRACFEDRLILLPRPIARALGIEPGRSLQIGLRNGEVRVPIPKAVGRRALFRASAGWPAIRRALRVSRLRRG